MTTMSGRRHDNCVPTTLRPSSPDRPVSSDEEIIMLGLYEWLHEEIEAENAARRESSEG